MDQLYGIFLYAVFLLTMGGIYAVLALGLNIQWGFTGLFNAGVGGFFAVGAYVSAILTSAPSTRHLGGYDLPVPAGVCAAMVASALVAWGIGRICIRLRSDYLAIATLGIAEILRLVLKNEIWATNGARGISQIPKPFEHAAEPWNQVGMLLLVFAIVLVLYVLLERARRSPWGRVMAAIRENEDAARAAGKDVERLRVEAFILGAALMGLGGALMAHHIKFIEPNAAEPVSATFLVWVMLIIGGSGNNRGAILGAIPRVGDMVCNRNPDHSTAVGVGDQGSLPAHLSRRSCAPVHLAEIPGWHLPRTPLPDQRGVRPPTVFQQGESIMKRKLIAAVGAALSLGGAGAMAADVKVGSAGGVTGPIAELVVAIMDARDLAATHVNEQGGLLGGDTYQLVRGDSQCDPKAAVDAGTKLVNVEQVVAVLGANCSGATNGMAQSVTVPAGVVMLSDTATAPSISELADNDLVFRVAASDAYQGRSLAELAWANGYRSLAVTYSNDDYNAGLAGVFETAFKELGGTITASQVHEPDKASYRSELSTLAGAGGEGLALFAYYGSSGITILRNSLENGLFGKFLGADGMMDNSVIEQIGADTLRGNIMLSQPASDTEDASYQAFAAAFEAAGNNPGAPFVAHSYDIGFLMALAIEKAGAADRSKISAALREVANAPGTVIRPGEWEKAKAAIAAGENINYEGASGAIEFDANGDVAGTYSLNGVGDDGTWTPM